MTERPFAEVREGGTVEITPEGWLRIFNADGKEVAAVRPDGPLWCMIVEQGQAQIRRRLLSLQRINDKVTL